MRRPSRPAAPLTLARTATLLGLMLSLSLLAASQLPAQSLNELNDLLGGSDSALIPSKQVEPKVTVTLTSADELKAGTTLTLAIKAEYGRDAYTYSQNTSFGGATKINVTEVYGLEAVDDAFQPDHPPKVAFEELVKQDLEKFPGGVTWTRTYRLTGDVPAADAYIAGNISYQVCDKHNCRPLREEFEAFPELTGDTPATPPNEVADAAPMPSAEAPPSTDAQPPAAALSPNVDEPSMRAAAEPLPLAEVPLEFNLASQKNEGSLPWYLGMAFLGGLILNIMPCVLPVLAIKVMSFVQQAGESRGRVLALNVCYSLGVIGVFLVLASLAIFPQILGQRLGWGGLFQRPEFNLAMIGLVFAMGLSMLGVFEIPIPGMIGSAGGQHREGLFGAFAIGIFATLLATPCSGPLMTTVLAWSVKQEPTIVYLVWGVMGLGMASPFLIVGLVPALAKFIPRPGTWMVRFKEFSGFALLAAVLWLMNSLPAETILPTLIMLLGLGLGLWMVGGMYNHSSTFTRKMTVRFYALLTTGLICWFGFMKYTEGQALADARRAMPNMATVENSLRQDNGSLPWEAFSGARVTELLGEGRTVLIDFTANWCPICKQNEFLALNTSATNQLVRDHGIATLKADYTRHSPEIEEWLGKFGSNAIPLTVIVPADDPQNPIVLDGPYTQSTLLTHLQDSVPAKAVVQNTQSTQPSAHGEGSLPWEPFTGARLTELLRAGKPVLVDFTADWCLICKQNEKFALNTEATNDFVRKNGVVTLYADYTRQNPEIQEWLEKFNSISVPLTVIFPAGDPQNPHILDGPYTESTLLDYLQQAIPANVAVEKPQPALVDAASP